MAAFRSPVALLAFGGVAACAVLPEPARDVAVLAAVIGLGIPHGALDGEIARPLLRPRLGRFWLPPFALPYLGLAALVLGAWRLAPGPTLIGFLAVSALHFGIEDGADGPAVPVVGALPIAVPALAHPAATAAVFATVSGLPVSAVAPALHAAALCWLGGAAVAVGVLLSRGGSAALAGPVVLALPLAMLPPLVGFGAYFVALHGPRHMRSLIADPVRAPRICHHRSAWLRAMPFSALTLVIGALLWPLFPGAPPARLLMLTLQGLSALTVPHLVVEAWTTVAAGARPAWSGWSGARRGGIGRVAGVAGAIGALERVR